MILSLTSTRANADAINRAQLFGDVVACEDVLYEGPLMQGKSPVEMARIRSQYFSQQGMTSAKILADRYIQRLARIHDFAQYDEMILWFSDNLYNQLILLQLLYWLSELNTGRLEITYISPDRLPVSKHLRTFDVMSDDQIYLLYKKRLDISINQIDIARSVWQAICSDDPRDLLGFTPRHLAAIPYLADAVQRLIQQYPSKSNGLSRSEKQILEIMSTGENDLEKIFIRTQRKEDKPFMNQTMFWLTVSRLVQAEMPAIELEQDEPDDDGDDVMELTRIKMHMTTFGKSILRNHDDWIHHNGIDRWVGGVHIHDRNIWRWDGQHKSIMRTYV
ncbi:MAG: DUF1835 domain-containing protein [Gammaproteobacteria bacterium]|nr:DUF1835 domain-containing protein [Gammaproteobacteria bacterium]